MLKGSDFIAVRRISNKKNDTLAAVGETCERVPEQALAGLEARGAVRRAEGVAAPRARRAARANGREGG